MDRKGMVMNGINLIFAVITIIILLTIAFIFSSFYGSENASFIYEEQNSAKESSKIIMLLGENEGYFAKKISEEDTDEFFRKLKEIYGEDVQCRLKIDALEHYIGCKKITKVVEGVDLIVPGYNGNIHKINMEVAQ